MAHLLTELVDLNKAPGFVAKLIDYDFLKDWLTAERVGEYFGPMGASSVTRYELPNLGALNFIVHGILSNSLRTDAQGKGLGQIMLAIPLER